jgi:hypothetical protein
MRCTLLLETIAPSIYRIVACLCEGLQMLGLFFLGSCRSLERMVSSF